MHHYSGRPPPPAPQLPGPEEERAKRAALGASLSLLGFAVLTSLALAAWFSRAAEPWSWKAIVAILSAMLGLTTSALMWRAPSRSHALAGIIVMILSVIRVGSPWDWTWISFALISITALMLVPLINAALILR